MRSSAAQVPLLASACQSSRKRRKSSSRRVAQQGLQRARSPRRGAASRRSRGSRRGRSCSCLAASRAARPPRRSRPGDLEHVAQPLGGDPHVVLGRRRAGLERLLGEAAQLVEPGARRCGAALSRSGAPGRGPSTLRAFTRRRLDQLVEAAAQLRQPLRGDEGREVLVRLPLLARAARSISALERCRSASGDLAGEALEEVDLDVAVAALAERVGERLDLASAPCGSACAGSRARRPPAPPAAAASPPACRGRARPRRGRGRRARARRPPSARTSTTRAAARAKGSSQSSPATSRGARHA